MYSDERWSRLAEALYKAKATTLDGAITNFLQALELTNSQGTLVSARQNAVRTRAEASALIDVYDSRLIGSYARSSQIRSLSSTDFIDVDCLLILKTSEYNLNKYWRVNDGGWQVLEDLRRSLDGYQGLSVRIDSPAVTITWNDMKMELVPAFSREGGGYLIPSPGLLSRSWQATDPVTDEAKFAEANAEAKSKGKFKPMVKMLKCWNRTNNKILGSFPLETIAYHSTLGSFQDLGTELSWFFKTLRESNGKSFNSPSGIGSPISVQLAWHQVNTLQQVENQIKHAYSAAAAGRHNEAIAVMASVFGRPFQGAT